MSPCTKLRPLWALIADVHLHEKWLDEMEPTLNWLMNSIAELRPSAVFFLGDSLHTKERVHVQTQLRLIQFVQEIRQHTNAVHIIVGNHDMSRISDAAVNSVSVLHNPKEAIHVYDRVTEKVIDGQRVLFMPYYNDQRLLVPILQQLRQPEEVTVFGHLAIDGVPMRGISSEAANRSTVCTGKGLALSHFSHVKQTFTGHFHTHAAYLDRKFVYVGSPKMFNFGDVGQIAKGFVRYFPEQNDWDLVHNPYAESHIDLDFSAPNLVKSYAGHHVRLRMKTQYNSSTSADLAAFRDALIFAGAKSVKIVTESDHLVPQAITTQHFGVEEIPGFAEQYATAAAQEAHISLFKEIWTEVIDSQVKTVFHCSINTVQCCDFMSIGGTKTFHYDSLKPGVWMIRGNIGSGKSLLLEMLAYTLFGKTLRGAPVASIGHLGCKDFWTSITFSNGVYVKRGAKGGKQFLNVRLSSGQSLECATGITALTERLVKEVLNTSWDMFNRSVTLRGKLVADFFVAKKDQQTEAFLEQATGMAIFHSLDTAFTKKLKTIRVQTKEHDLNLAAATQALDRYKLTLEHETEMLTTTRTQRDTIEASINEFHLDMPSYDTLKEARDRVRAANASLTKDNRKSLMAQRHLLVERHEELQKAELVYKQEKSLYDRLTKELQPLKDTVTINEFDLHHERVENENALAKKKLFIECVKADIHTRKATLQSLQAKSVDLTLYKAQIEKLKAQLTNNACVYPLSQLRTQLERLGSLNTRVDTKQTLGEVSDLLYPCSNLHDNIPLALVKVNNLAAQWTETDLPTSIEDTEALILKAKERDALQVELAKVIARHEVLNESAGDTNFTVLIEAEVENIKSTEQKCRLAELCCNELEKEKVLLQERTATLVNQKAQVLQRQSLMERRDCCEANLKLMEPFDLNVLQTLAGSIASLDRELEENDKKIAKANATLIHCQRDLQEMLEKNERLALALIKKNQDLKDVLHQIRQQSRLVVETQALYDKAVSEKTKLEWKSKQLEDLESAAIFWENACSPSSVRSKGGFRQFCLARFVDNLNQWLEQSLLPIDGTMHCRLDTNLQLDTSQSRSFALRSTGEQQQTQLAVLFTLLEYVTAHASFKIDLLFIDELYQNMDADARALATSWIASYTQRHPTLKTLIIHHFDTDDHGDTGTINVKKDCRKASEYICSQPNFVTVN